MPYEPLHHKYRPQTFADLVGQKTIALTLSNALKQGRIAPAYLFTGPRGTGKTSSARILAKSLNCLSSSQPTANPCGQCEACLAIAKGSALDVMEIDAASNTGVDNIREIIERSRFAPVQCRYKIYAIDECHMLSTAAFNALLKTLEEPPPQVVFILATTDPQRVLSTIISRCQRFDYRRIPLREMTAHLKYIATAEQIAITDDALTLIAQIANGGLRDAESLLDQLSLLPETISVAKVWDLVGAVPEQDLLILLQAIRKNNSLAVLNQCRSLLDRGKEPLVVLQNLASFYLNLLIAKTAPQRSEMTSVTETCWQELCTEANNWNTGEILRGQQHLKSAETQLKQTTQPRLWLEVTLLGLSPQTKLAIANQGTVTVNSNSTPNPVPAPSIASKQPLTTATSNHNHAGTRDIPPQVKQTPPTTVTATPTQKQLVDAKLTVVESPTATVSPNDPRVKSPIEVTSATQKMVEPAAPSNSHQDPLVNQQLWSKVISCLQPPTTQALVKQQCHLVNFDGISAIVGISSARLQKLNQGKVPNIESAFAQVCQRPVKVQLEVANTQALDANKATVPIQQSATEVTTPTPQKTATPVATANLPTVQQVKNEVSQPDTPPVAKPAAHNCTPQATPVNSATNNHHPQASNNQVQETGTHQTSVLPSKEIAPENQNVTPETIAEPELAQDYAPNDLQQAIDSLTQSFAGEVVQLNDREIKTLEVPEAKEKAQPVSHLDRPNTEDYDDDW